MAQLHGAASGDTPPLPHAPGLGEKKDTATAERVMEHIDAGKTRKASKKAARKAQREAAAKAKVTGLRKELTHEPIAQV